ncbi:MAG TPA: hypothetical protein VF303_04555 [Candidatus Nanoarchaeia archaeon]
MEDTEPRKKLVNWLSKIKFLKDQIEKLEKLKDFPIVAISVFLLKCQIIEFELKQFIFSLDLHLYSQNHSKLLRRKIRSPKDLDDLTLGKLKKELNQFIRPLGVPIVFKTGKSTAPTMKDTLEELKLNLGLLVDKRNEFTHRLFSQGKEIVKMNEEAVEGIEVASRTIYLLEILEKEIKDYEN